MKRMAGQAKVFVGGSRRLSRLNKEVRRRLDNIVEKGLTVFVGDANGADKAVQRYLADKRYDKVVVFCMAGGCRNNIGDWPTSETRAASGARGFSYYATKDRAMAAEADYGLMLWDGSSRGTFASVLDLVLRGKPVVVYAAPSKSCVTLRGPAQLTEWLRGFDPGILPRVERDLHAAGLSGSFHRIVAAPLF